VAVKIEPAARVNNADAIYRLGLAGLGIIRVNEFIGAQALREGRLVPVLPEYPCADGSQMLALYPHERNRLPRVAAMLDFLVEAFAAHPWRAAQAPAKPRRPPLP
jgi:DNA-binding transcriptional LysR family regulator